MRLHAIISTAIAIALLLPACGGSTPVRTHYLLRATAHSGPTQTGEPPRVGVARVVVAPYLDQAGLVVATGTNEVRPARNHVWAEPLDEGLRLYLRAEISRALGEEVALARGTGDRWEYSVEVFFEQFHGTLDGRALLEATYRVHTAGAEPAEYRFSREASLSRSGYGGLVEAERKLAAELAAAIAASLRARGAAP